MCTNICALCNCLKTARLFQRHSSQSCSSCRFQELNLLNISHIKPLRNSPARFVNCAKVKRHAFAMHYGFISVQPVIQVFFPRDTKVKKSL